MILRYEFDLCTILSFTASGTSLVNQSSFWRGQNADRFFVVKILAKYPDHCRGFRGLSIVTVVLILNRGIEQLYNDKLEFYPNCLTQHAATTYTQIVISLTGNAKYTQQRFKYPKVSVIRRERWFTFVARPITFVLVGETANHECQIHPLCDEAGRLGSAPLRTSRLITVPTHFCFIFCS